MRFKKHTLFLLSSLFLSLIINAQISICSWNIINLGKSKSDCELEFIAKTINNYDIITIQEVVTKN